MASQSLLRAASVVLAVAASLTSAACTPGTGRVVDGWTTRAPSGWPITERADAPPFPTARVPLADGPARVDSIPKSATRPRPARIHWRITVQPSGGMWVSDARQRLEVAGFHHPRTVRGDELDRVNGWMSLDTFTVHVLPSQTVPGALVYDVVEYTGSGSGDAVCIPRRPCPHEMWASDCPRRGGDTQ